MKEREKQYLVEFKVGEKWVETVPFDSIDEPRQIEETLHSAGMKARIIIRTISSEIYA